MTAYDLGEAAVKKAVITSARRIIAAADGGKLGRTTHAYVGPSTPWWGWTPLSPTPPHPPTRPRRSKAAAPLSRSSESGHPPDRSGADVRADRLFDRCRPCVEFQDLPADPGLVEQFGQGGGDVVTSDLTVELGRPEGHGAGSRTVQEQRGAQDQPVQVTAAECDVGALLHSEVVLDLLAEVAFPPGFRKHRHQREALRTGEARRLDRLDDPVAVDGRRDLLAAAVRPGTEDDHVDVTESCRQLLHRHAREIADSRVHSSRRQCSPLVVPAYEPVDGVSPRAKFLREQTTDTAGDADDEDVHLGCSVLSTRPCSVLGARGSARAQHIGDRGGGRLGCGEKGAVDG